MFFFFNDTATTEIYTLSLHDALPIFGDRRAQLRFGGDRESLFLRRGREDHAAGAAEQLLRGRRGIGGGDPRSEEHTSELQSQSNLVCRLLLEKKKTKILYRQLLYQCE